MSYCYHDQQLGMQQAWLVLETLTPVKLGYDCAHPNVDLDTGPVFLSLSRGLLPPVNHLFLRSRYSANFQKHLIMFTFSQQR